MHACIDGWTDGRRADGEREGEREGGRERERERERANWVMKLRNQGRYQPKHCESLLRKYIKARAGTQEARGNSVL